MRAYTIAEHDNLKIVSWVNLKKEGEGAILDCALLKPLSVALEGVFGEDTRAMVMGSLANQSKFFPLKSHQNFPIMTRIEGLFEIKDSCLYLKPKILGGSESTNINVYLLCKVIPKRRLGR